VGAFATRIGAAAGILLAAGPAAAHARLLSMSPASGSSVASAPAEIDLTFDEAVSTELATIAVTAPDGTDVTAGPAHANGAVVSVALKPLTATGSYSVAYRVISDDGHPVSDQLKFTLTVVPAAGQGAPQPAAAPAAAVVSVGGDDIQSNWWATHVIHLVVGAAVIGVGGWLMLILTKPPRRPPNSKA
jgi:methionine-rich copper-binding protein CopC